MIVAAIVALILLFALVPAKQVGANVSSPTDSFPQVQSGDEEVVYRSPGSHYAALRQAIITRVHAINPTLASTGSSNILSFLPKDLGTLQPVDAYSQAAIWMVQEDTKLPKFESDLLSRFVLAVTFLLNQESKESPLSMWKHSENWMTAADQCEWYGVRCSTDHGILEVDLSYNGLSGPVHEA